MPCPHMCDAVCIGRDVDVGVTVRTTSDEFDERGVENLVRVSALVSTAHFELFLP